MSTEIIVNNDIIEINVTEYPIIIEAPSGAYPLPSGVYSVYGRTGNVVAQDGDYTLTQLGDVTISSPSTGQVLRYNGTTWENHTESYIGTVTSVNASVPTGMTISGNPITTSGILAFGLDTGYTIPLQSTLDAKALKATTITIDGISHDLSANSTFQVLPALGTTGQILAKNSATSYDTVWIDNYTEQLRDTVKASVAINKGQAVYISGASGNNQLVSLASNTSEATSSKTLGLAAQNFAINDIGQIITEGLLSGINTSTATAGDPVWLGTNGNLIFGLTNKPAAPAHLVYIGVVTRVQSINGEIYVKIQNGFELQELHNVSITSPANGNILQYNSTDSLWHNVAGTTTNIAEGTNLYYTDARSRAALSFAVGSGAYNSTTGVITIPTNNTQITNGAGYITLTSLSSGTGINYNNTTGVINSTITQYTDALARAAISLTVSGNSGSSTYSSLTGVLNVPTYTLSGLGGEPIITAGTTAQYWRGDKSWQTLNTTAVVEGTNLYYTQARFNTAFSNKTTTDLTEGTNLYYTQTRFNTAFAAKSTTDLTEGTNLYFTTARAQSAISGTSPISVASGVVSISQSGTLTNGYLSSTDWNTFNNKQTAGNYITALTGEATASGPGSAAITLTNSAVIGKVLTGVNITGGSITATDSILTAFGKVQNQINGLIGGSIYKGTWNASTNTPTLASGVGTSGNYYIVSVAGTTNLDGITDWNVGDWAIYQGTTWQKVDNTDAVVSVNGFTGAISLTTSNISEGTNLYYTNTRARASVSAGTGISYNSSTGVITNSAPDQTVALTAGTGISTSGVYPNFTITNTAPNQIVALTGAGTTVISGTYPNFTITTNDQYTGTVTSVAASVPTGFAITGSPITSTGTLAISYAAGYALPTTASQANWDSAYAARITSATGPLSIATNAISIAQANTTTSGYLSSTDWNTFNSKQGTITLTSTGSSGSATLVSNTLNVPTYTLAGLGGISLTSLSATTPLSYNSTTGAFTIAQATTSTSGYLSSTDWNTFNGKQSALTNPVTGTGTTNYHAKFTGASTIGNSLIWDNGTNVGIGNTNTSYTLDVSGTGRFNRNDAANVNLTLANTYLNQGNLINFQQNKAGSTINAYIGHGGDNSGNFIINNGTQAVTITQSGNVGIGTSSPSAISTFTTLEIRGATGGGIKIGKTGIAQFNIQQDGTDAYFNNTANGSMYFYTNDTERMKITSAGNVGIGSSSPNGPLDIIGASYDGKYTISCYDSAAVAADIGGGIYFGGNYNGTTKTGWAGIVGKKDNATSGEYGGYMGFYTRTNGSGPAERMRITSGGNVEVKTSGAYISFFGTTQNVALQSFNDTTLRIRTLLTGNGALNVENLGTGLLYSNGATLTSTNPSDIRLKENINDITWGLSDILKIRPVSYHWKDDKINQGVQFGFIAQEVQDVMPEAIKEFGDDIIYLGLEKDAIYATLVKAIQELNDRLTKAGL